MRSTLLASLAVVLFGAAAACSSSDEPAKGETSPTTPAETSDAGSTTTQSNGLPCDVEKLLATRCAGCHVEGGDAPMALKTYDDLKASAPSDDSKTVAEAAIGRMRSKTKPMPPRGALPSAEIVVLEKWVADGMTAGTCEE